MAKKRYIVVYSKSASSYIIADTNDNVPENACGFGLLWGTENPDKASVQTECDKVNKGQEPKLSNVLLKK